MAPEAHEQGDHGGVRRGDSNVGLSFCSSGLWPGGCARVFRGELGFWGGFVGLFHFLRAAGVETEVYPLSAVEGVKCRLKRDSSRVIDCSAILRVEDSAIFAYGQECFCRRRGPR